MAANCTSPTCARSMPRISAPTAGVSGCTSIACSPPWRAVCPAVILVIVLLLNCQPVRPCYQKVARPVGDCLVVFESLERAAHQCVVVERRTEARFQNHGAAF